MPRTIVEDAMKTITFRKYGDFYEFITDDVEEAHKVAAALGRIVTRLPKLDKVTVGVPYWQEESSRFILAGHGYEVVYEQGTWRDGSPL